MKLATLSRRLLPHLFTLQVLLTAAARADFKSGQLADRSLGDALSYSGGYGSLRAMGMAVDPVSHKLFVADTLKHRILRFASSASLEDGAAPEAVLGQLDFQSAGPQPLPSGLNEPTGLAMDAQGRLWVADTGNHRVLRFDNAASLASGSPPAGVLGQSRIDAGSNPLTIVAGRMQEPTGLCVSTDGTLWVADRGNNRVLRFDNAAARPAGAAADAVLGQADFTHGSPALGADRMNTPFTVTAEIAYNAQLKPITRLWVADYANNRVLSFDDARAKPNGSAADRVLGQPDFLSAGVGVQHVVGPSALVVSNNRLWVADRGNHRVLRFDNVSTKANGSAASGVLLQPDFITRTTPATPTASNGICAGLAVSNAGRLYACDFSGARVLWFNNAATRANGATADGVLGAPDFVTQGSFDPGWNNMGQTAACVMDRNGRLWVGGSYVVGPQPFGIVLRFRPTLESAPEFRQDYFGNTTQSLTADSDGDGVANLMEYAQNTDPTDAASVKRLRIYASPGSRPEIICNFPYPAKTDLRLTFQYSPNMQPGWWSTLCQRSGSGAWSGAWLPYVGPETGDVAVRHTTAYPTPAAFYRMKVEVLP